MQKIITIFLVLVCMVCFFNVHIYATSITDPTAVIESMSDANTMADASNDFGNAINTIIGLFQVAGTGIAVVVVSMLGIKYLLASPSQKADTKKQIMPIVIGCILLFGAVNLVAAVSEFATKALSKS